MRKHFMYGAWAGMVNRCHNPNNSSYSRYGAVGIRVCDRWRFGEDGMTGFECFLLDMGERPEGKTLDRFPDNAGNYERANCRWSTLTEQRANLSDRGRRDASEKGSAKRLAYWQAWRAENDIRPELTPNQQRRLLQLVEADAPPPADGRERKSFISLVEMDLAEVVDDLYRITEKGRAWTDGGRPQMRCV